MKRVLVIWPPKLEYIFSIQKHYTNFGETIAFLDSQPDFEVDVMDGSALLHFQWDFIEAYSREYDFLVVYTDLHNSISAIRAVQQCKDISPNTIAISYGQGTPYAPETYLEQGFDAAVIDPMYQRSILDFMRYTSGENVEENLRGVYFKESGRVVKIEQKSLLNVAEVAFPALNKLPVEHYKRISGRDQICFTVARGCFYSCRFCRVPVDQGRSVSYRPIEDVINYVKQVKKDFASVKFIAPTFSANRNYVLELCDAVCMADIKFKWTITTRLELLDHEMLKALSKAGCIAIAFGMETLYEETQKHVDKHLSRDFMTKQIQLISQNGIIPKAFIMLGIPGQTKREIDETYAYLREHNVEVRPKEYYPYELLSTSQDKLELLKFFERDQVYKTRIDDVDPLQFVKWMMNRTSIR